MLTGHKTPASTLEGRADGDRIGWFREWDVFYSNAPVAMSLLDPALRYVRVNERFAQINQKSIDAHLGRRVDEVSADVAAKLLPSLRLLVEGNHSNIELILKNELERGVPEDDIQRFNLWATRDSAGKLRFVSVMVRDESSARDQAAASQEQEVFSRLLSRLSSEFTNIAPGSVDAKIDEAMARLVNFLDVQRLTLSEMDADSQLRITHCHAAPGFQARAPGSVKLGLPWFAEMLQKGQTICISSPGEIPLYATQERIVTAASGINATIVMPFSVGGMPLCALSVGSSRPRKWSGEEIARLKVTGEVLANALARKRSDEKLQRTQENLAHMSRVSTVGQLTTSITHEINQPLCAMVSNAEAAMRYLAAENPNLAEATAALNEIVQDGKRAGEVIVRTYAMLKRHTVKFERHDINSLIEGVRPVVANYAMIRRLSFQMILNPAVPRVHGHAVQLQQVVINLLINAIDAVAVEPTSKGMVAIKTSFDAKAKQVIVTVTDNGIGLPPAALDLVFEPFYTSKPSGLGMGLSIARTIIDAHGGRLWAENNPGRGASFSFSLPIPKEPIHE